MTNEMTHEDSLDFSDTLEVIAELRGLIDDLQAIRPNIEVNNRRVNSEKAEINRRLLYAAHLADAARLDIMSQYHRFKGENPPFLSV